MCSIQMIVAVNGYIYLYRSFSGDITERIEINITDTSAQSSLVKVNTLAVRGYNPECQKSIRFTPQSGYKYPGYFTTFLDGKFK